LGGSVHRTTTRLAWASAVMYAFAVVSITSCDRSNHEAVTAETWGAFAPDELRDPPVIASTNGVLDLLVIAKSAVIPQFAPYVVSGWVYDVCSRPASGAQDCPVTGADSAYGGTRLQLEPGDTLKIHLVNKLPADPDLAPASRPAEAYLGLNPTNIHLHGMLVSPRYASSDDATWGDNVFVYNFNSSNGLVPDGSELHGTAVYDAVDYTIPVPQSHPAGLYWFHPHVHGISGRQISSGLGGIITVGGLAAYACPGANCSGAAEYEVPARHLVIKDIQVERSGHIQSQSDSRFCGNTNDQANQGGCAGLDLSANGGPNYLGGRWFFTITGQPYPTITVGTPLGQIWRIVNASANVTYDLDLWNPDTKNEMLLRVVSIDGVSVDYSSTGNPSHLNDGASGRFEPVPCPDPGGLGTTGVCTTRLHMMPSSRAEVWVAYRDARGVVGPSTSDARAVLRTTGYQSGPNDATWPAIDLAKVRFAQGSAPFSDVSILGRTEEKVQPVALAENLRESNVDVPGDPNCKPLAPGHRRRIFFNVAADGPNPFGLGYEELDSNGVPVPGTFVDVHAFDPTAPTVCLPLGPGNTPVTEQWELVNISEQDHNFHIHQAHFSVLSAPPVAGTALVGQLNGRSVIVDSLPLPRADGRCITVQDWRAGACTAHTATVELSFAIAGDFVYHCHILNHEDGGMMAVIRVRSDGAQSTPSIVQRLLAGLGRAAHEPQPVLMSTAHAAMHRASKSQGSVRWP
jgi:L-ascorbate oxidase